MDRPLAGPFFPGIIPVQPGPLPVLEQGLPLGFLPGKAVFLHDAPQALGHIAVDEHPHDALAPGQQVVGAKAHHHAGTFGGQLQNLFLPAVAAAGGQGVHMVKGDVQFPGQAAADLPPAAAVFPCNGNNHPPAPFYSQKKTICQNYNERGLMQNYPTLNIC